MTTQNDLITIPTVEDLTRRTFISGALASALLVACGGDSDDESPDAGASNREVSDMFGPVSLPSQPQRVIANFNTTLGTMLALGVKPVGANVNPAALPEYLTGAMDGVVNVTGEGMNYINLEAALSLDPDLIVAVGGGGTRGPWNQENCDLYKQAVATYCYASNYTYIDDLRNAVMDIATALGLEQKGREVLQDLDNRIAELKQKVTAAGFNDKPISLIRYYQDGRFTIRTGAMESIVFRALGIPQPEGQRDPTILEIPLSTERLNVLEASHVVLVAIDNNSSMTRDDILNNDIWQQLTPTRENRVLFVNSGVWNSVDVLAAHAIMNDIEKLVLPLANQR